MAPGAVTTEPSSEDIPPTCEAILFRVLKLSVKSNFVGNDNLPRRHWFEPGLRRLATPEGALRKVTSREGGQQPAERGSSSSSQLAMTEGPGALDDTQIQRNMFLP